MANLNPDHTNKQIYAMLTLTILGTWFIAWLEKWIGLTGWEAFTINIMVMLGAGGIFALRRHR